MFTTIFSNWLKYLSSFVAADLVVSRRHRSHSRRFRDDRRSRAHVLKQSHRRDDKYYDALPEVRTPSEHEVGLAAGAPEDIQAGREVGFHSERSKNLGV